MLNVISVKIYSQDLLTQFNISDQEVENVIDYTIKEIAGAFASRLEETALRELKGTGERYKNNIRVVDEGRMSGAVILDYSKDPLIQMIEEGATPFDMKEGFSKSSKKKIKKDGGWYLTIPFKVGSPGASVTGFANVMPSQIYNIAKEKVINPLNNRSQGIKKDELPKGFEIPKTRAAIVIPESKTFAEYKHKASIFQGIYKSKDEKTGQNVYGSFRRVSDNSDENAWIHPGIQERNLMDKTLDRFEPIIEEVTKTAMDKALEYFGFE